MMDGIHFLYSEIDQSSKHVDESYSKEKNLF
jgi:hypothetical protein